MTVQSTLQERGSRYGTFSDNAKTTQALMVVLMEGATAETLKPQHLEALHMICHKMARIVNGDTMWADNAHDIAGYAVLLEEWIIKNRCEDV